MEYIEHRKSLACYNIVDNGLQC